MGAFKTSGTGTAEPGAVELRRAAAALREIADTIDRMAGGAEVRGPVAADVIDMGQAMFRAYARRALRIRRTLGTFFDAGLFADPARDILFELFAAAEEGAPVDLDRCAAVAAIPRTTARRWLDRLHRQNIVAFVGDDAEAIVVRLSCDARERMRAYLAAAYAIPLSARDQG